LWCAGLEGLLLGSLLLEWLVLLLSGVASELRLKLRRWLLSKALRLARVACELRLHWSPSIARLLRLLRLLSKASLLGRQSALEALLLLERLLLAILGLRRPSSTVPAP
jgi:hypothetical protein